MVALKEDVELGKAERISPAGEDAVGKCRMAIPGETWRCEVFRGTLGWSESKARKMWEADLESVGP